MNWVRVSGGERQEKRESQMNVDGFMDFIDIMREEIEKIRAVSDVLSVVCASRLEENTVRTLGMLQLISARVLQEKLEGLEIGERRQV